MDDNQPNLLSLTAQIISAHSAANNVEDLPALITQVYAALSKLSSGATAEAETPPVESRLVGAVTARKSLSSPENIVSMIDGKPYRTLKRHITRHGYAPESYREAFGLRSDYPMVAPAYSAARSAMAKAVGLGRKPGTKVAAKRGPRKAAPK